MLYNQIMKKAVLVDIDDTLANTQTKILEYVNSHSARSYKIEEITNEFREGLNREYNTLIEDFLAEPDLVSQIEPFDDALIGMKRLAQADYEIHITSSRKENLHDVSSDWLLRHGFMGHIHHIHPRFSTQRGHHFKLEAASSINAIAAFDDTLSVVETLAEIVPELYLINKPWNASRSAASSIKRVESFAQGVDIFLAKHSH